MNTTTQSTEGLAGHDVTDTQGNKMGTVDAVWLNGTTNDVQYIGVKTGWPMGKTHVVPMTDSQINRDMQTIQVPYTADQVKNAPTFLQSTVLNADQQKQIADYYQNLRSPTADNGIQTEAVPARTATIGPGDFPVDDVTYDLYALIAAKLNGMQAFDQYLDDARGDPDLSSMLSQMRQQDAQSVQQLQQYLIQRVSSGSTSST